MKERVVMLEDLSSLAQEVLADVRAHPRLGAAVIAMSGELGAGKTTFTKALAEALGVQGDVTSPTFVIQKTYETADADFRTLVHIDAYRIESPEELSAIGFRELLLDAHALIVVEWAERVAGLLPQSQYVVACAHRDETSRHVRSGTTEESTE